jgi:hypothetical protein
MAVKIEPALVHSITAGADLSGSQYFAVSLDDGALSVNGAEAGGILINKPKSGEAATIGVMGFMKFRAGGGTIAKDAWLTVTTSGYCVTAGSGYHLVGKCRESVTSGSIGTGYFNFINPPYAESSMGIL